MNCKNCSMLECDTCSQKISLVQSRGPGMYKLKDRVTYESCFMQFPGYLAHDENSGTLPSAVDDESELQGLNYKNSKCPSEKYNPQKFTYKKDPVQKDCPNQMIPEFTRERKPANGLAGININRFEPLCIDVQKNERIQSNAYIGQATRYTMKDISTSQRKKTKTSLCECSKIQGEHRPLECMYEPKSN